VALGFNVFTNYMAKVKVLNSKDGYNILADYYAKKEKYWDSFEKDQVLPLLGEVEDKKILELGAVVTALDVSQQMLNKLKIQNSKFKISTMIGEAENLEFAGESFDVVVATFLIVHLKDLARFFDEAYRVLKPGGLFLVTNINQRKAPEIKVGKDLVEVESYYHRPEQVLEVLEALAFCIVENKFIKEGEVWINQIVLAKK